MATIITDGRSATQSLGSGALYDLVLPALPPAGSFDQIWVEFLDKNLVSQGILQFATLNATLYFNAVGSWSVTVPYTDALWNQILSGDFFVQINWRGLFSFGGKCEKPEYTDSIPGTGGMISGPYITLSGADYLGLVANRICYPSPGVAWNAQTAAANDPVSNLALESAIKHYVYNNMGIYALPARQLTIMDVATDQARGPNVSYTVKFGTGVDLNLLDVIRALVAQTNIQMGVQITRNPTTHRLLFDCYLPRNLTGKAWFSETLGNLTAVDFSLTDPTVTDSLVQGAGTTFLQVTSSAKTSWNVIEHFTDSSSETDANNLNTTAQTDIDNGAMGATMTITATDTPMLTFGRDYYLGDQVSIEVRPGANFSDIVSSVTLTVDPTQSPPINAVPTIGNSANSTSSNSEVISQLAARIRTLERHMSR